MAVTVGQIDDAISKIVQTGQSVTLPNGESYTRARLAELEALRVRVINELAGQAAGGGYGFSRVAIRTGGN